MKASLGLALLFVMALGTGCTSSTDSSSSTGYSAESASGVMGGVGVGVAGAGTLMGKSAFGSNAIAFVPKGFLSHLLPSAFASGEGLNVRCDSHGSAMNAAGSVRLTPSDADYAALSFMCMMAYNSFSPDTVQGGYTQIKSIACAVERAGAVYDGADHATTMVIDTNCFTSAQMTGMGLTAGQTMSVTVNASKPWSVNNYYDAGVTLTIPGFGVFKYGAKVDGTKIEFAAAEDQTGSNPFKTGAYAGSWDRGTGELRFESRFDRFRAACGGVSCSGSSQGFGRHFRLFAKMTADSTGAPSGNLSTISALYATVNKGDDTFTTGSNGTVLSASGDLTTTGVKTKVWGINGITTDSGQSALRTFASYNNMTPPEGCYTTTTSTSGAGTCGSGLIPTGNFDFMEAYTGSAGTSYTAPLAWLAGLSAGLTYTSVTQADIQ